MSLNIKDLGLRDLVQEVVDDLQAGYVYFLRQVYNYVDSEFEPIEHSLRVIASSPVISIKELSIYETVQIYGSMKDGLIAFKTPTSPGLRAVDTGDFAILNVSGDWTIVKGSVVSFNNARMSTLMRWTIDLSEEPLFTDEQINSLGIQTLEDLFELPPEQQGVAIESIGSDNDKVTVVISNTDPDPATVFIEIQDDTAELGDDVKGFDW